MIYDDYSGSLFKKEIISEMLWVIYKSPLGKWQVQKTPFRTLVLLLMSELNLFVPISLFCEIEMCMRAKSLQLCPILGDTMDCSPPGSSVQGILQARILEWVAVPSSKGSS